MADLIPGLQGTIGPGEAPAAAGAGWAASTAALGQLGEAAGSLTNLMQAHQQVVDQAQLSELKTGLDNHAAQLAAANPGDPQGFAAAWGQARSDYIKNLPGRYALEMGAYYDQVGGTTYRPMLATSVARDHSLAMQANSDRLDTITSRVSDEYASGAPLATAEQSPVVQSGTAESDALIRAGVTAQFGPRTDANAANYDAAVAGEQKKLAATWKAAAFSGHVLQLSQTQGLPAALQEVQRLQKGGVATADGSQPAADPNSWEAGANITPEERALMVGKASEKLQQATSLQQQITSTAQAQRSAAQRDLDQRMQAEVDYQLHNGKPSGNGPTDSEIASVYGFGKVADFAKSKGDALQQNRDDGITPGMSSDQIAEQAAKKAALKPLDTDLGSTEKLSAFEQAILQTEGGVDAQGRPRVSDQGALGKYQLTVDEARTVARRMNLPQYANMSDAQLRTTLMAPDQQVNTLLGHDQVMHVAAKYGDPRLAAFAYHNGEGGADAAIAAHGRPDTDAPYEQWLANVAKGSPKGAAYVQAIADGMGQAQRVAAAQAAVTRANAVTTEAVNDPLGFGQTHGWGQVAPLNTGGFQGSPQDQQAFVASLRQRATQGAVIAAQHPGVPAKLLTGSEASYFSGVLSSNPAAAPKLAAAALSALGQEGATQFLHEVGQTGSAPGIGLQTALLAAGGRDRAVAAVTAGLQAKAAGAKEPPAAKAGMPYQGSRDPWEAAVGSIRPAFANAPGALSAIEATARTMRLGDAQTREPDAPADYIRAAMGGHKTASGQDFGGVASVNGAPVVHPPWMLNGSMPAALRIVGDSAGADGPRFSNGQPMKGADLARLQPRLQADGSYTLFDPRSGRVAGAANGAPYRVDFEAQKSMLARAGGIVGRS